jgi:hypothetical protein
MRLCRDDGYCPERPTSGQAGRHHLVERTFNAIAVANARKRNHSTTKSTVRRVS